MRYIVQEIIRGFLFPEGPLIYEGRLYLVDAYKGSVYYVVGEKEVVELINTGGNPTGLAANNGELYIADSGLDSVLKYSFKEKKLDGFVTQYEGKSLEAPNDLVFDSNGGLYFTAPLGSENESVGKVYYVDSVGKVSLFAEGMRYPNGVLLDLEQNNLFVAETRFQRILRFPLASPGNAAGSPCVFADLQGKPDGMCLDKDGNIYAALYGSGCVVRVNPRGRVEEIVEIPGYQPTNITINMEEGFFYVTEAEKGQVIKIEELP
ncbi:MAG: gluconolactonase [Candidatus Atribacteria bacterium]|nr:gluconolactonase [Candidatus Atribacteria bacterium]